MGYTPPPLNEETIEHTTHHGITFRCARGDLREPIDVIGWGLHGPRLLVSIAEFTGWHALAIFDHLNGFQGYGSIQFRLIDKDKEEP